MAKLILDVSKYDRGIDLAAWKNRRGLLGVIVKCGGSDQGQYEDSCFETHLSNAIRQNLYVGVYYYSAATTVAEANSDANHCLRILAGRHLDMPVYMDVEERRQLDMSESALTPVVEAFCNTIEANGYRAGIYSNTEGFMHMSSSVCRFSLWLAYWGSNRPSWASKDRGYDLWQQGSMSLSTGIVAYDDVGGNVDCNWSIGELPLSGTAVDVRKGVDMSVREKIVELARAQIGTHYYSMNYNWTDGWGGMGTRLVGRGTGCAQLVSYLFNTLLGTRYVGSCWNFSGDCLGDASTNQGGGEFEWVDAKDTEIGDIVLYCQSGYTGTDASDYGHTAILVGNGMVVGAMGRGVPGQSNYLDIGVRETTIATQSLGGMVRYARCKRLDKAPTPAPPTVYSTKLWRSQNTAHQQWHLHSVEGTDSVRFYNPERKMWLCVGGIKDNKAPVRVESCKESEATRWLLHKIDAKYVRYYKLSVADHPQLVLDAKGGGSTVGTGLQAYRDNGTIAQRWILVDSGDGIFRIVSAKSGLAIDCGPGAQ